MSRGTVHDLAYKGDFNQVKVQIDNDKDILLSADQNERLLIHWAALGGNHHLVEYLLECGSPVDPVDDTGITPLILAASADRYDCLRILIGKGADVNTKNSRGQSALQYACSKGYIKIVKLLLENDAFVNNKDVLRATPLHRAASQGRIQIVELLLNSNQNLEIDAQDSTGCTPLHLACEEGRDQVCVMLVQVGGAKLDIQNVEKKTPLEYCSPPLRKTLQNLK